MKINLTICGVHELPEQEGKRWTHVISIWDKECLFDHTCRERVEAVAPRAKLLFSFFADTIVPNHPNAPRHEDVKRILDFTKKLPLKFTSMNVVLVRVGIDTGKYSIRLRPARPMTFPFSSDPESDPPV